MIYTIKGNDYEYLVVDQPLTTELRAEIWAKGWELLEGCTVVYRRKIGVNHE